MTIASAPASSANLGPGFDIAALALDMRCSVEAHPADEWVVVSDGEPTSDETMEMVRAVVPGAAPHRVNIESEIPPARGLGSSAALLVAASAAISGSADPDEAFRRALVVEGHPDNAAAAAHGGLVLVGPAGTIHRCAIHPSLHVVLAVPDVELSTAEARRALPDLVTRMVAVRTAARLALLVEGLRSGDLAALRAALGDEMHEAPRRAITDLPASLIEAAVGSGAAYASWSGAGPSVIVFATEAAVDTVSEAMEYVLDGEGDVFEPDIDRLGLVVQ